MQNNAMTEEKIRGYLPPSLSSAVDISVYEITDSTNLRARELARGGVIRPSVILTDGQTDGRGRLGRSFHSESGVGIYMSFLLGGDTLGEDFTKITRYAAVKLARAIDSLAPIRSEIKWVNDIYFSGKKLAGILVEGVLDERGELKYAVIGIGVNVLRTEYPEPLRDIAASIEDASGKRVERSRLAARIIEEILKDINSISAPDIIEEYRTRSMLIGSRVSVIKPAEKYGATVLDISDGGALVVLRDSGEREELYTGEVSVKPL